MSDTDNVESTDPSQRQPSNRSNSRDGTQSAGQNPTSVGWDALKEHITTHKIDFVLALTRSLTVLCTLSYLVGIPGPASNRFKQALLMNAATSSLRLHQRMPPPRLNQINRAYFINLIREDSFHYLAFPAMFIMGKPITLALLPCTLHAIFNLAVYMITVLDKMGNQERLKTDISNLIAKYQQNLLHTVALSEIALMPIVVIGGFTRAISFFVPMLYYRFLVFRYNSIRNSHLKLLVSQIKAIAYSYYNRYMNR